MPDALSQDLGRSSIFLLPLVNPLGSGRDLRHAENTVKTRLFYARKNWPSLLEAPACEQAGHDGQ